MKQDSYSSNISAPVTAKEAVENINRVSDWWTRNLDGHSENLNDVFTVHFGETFATMKIKEIVPNKKIVWEVLDCYIDSVKDKKEWKGTEMVWDICAEGNNTVIKFTHVGMVPEIECFEDCKKGWGFFITDSLRKLITEKKGRPDTPHKERGEFAVY